ncbi:unnamed protein product [Scytosiphon promiscuus]
MMGSGGGLDGSVPPEDHGLIPRICSGIFERMYQARRFLASICFCFIFSMDAGYNDRHT